ncbi:hypothetical protein [Aeromonas media]|uniref:hypothetical protein n=1 Tax=Aeromonas media TaxID=651 RepID=UPI0022828D15|nr:hypothetical protein [Aeromonas media]MCY9824137.1 hypothetical protein [Aeromonas media]
MNSTEITFHWRDKNLKDAVLAIYYAVAWGYNTQEKLLMALPQFSKNRLLLALDLLFTSGMASANLGVLTVSEDIRLIERIVETKFVLPIQVDDLTAPVKRKVALGLGLKNAAGIDVLLFTKIKEKINDKSYRSNTSNPRFHRAH